MTSNIIRFQALLNRRYIRESEAAEYLDYLEGQLKWDRRAILRESLIALRMQAEAGWQPQEDIGEVQLTKDMVKMLRQLQQTVTKLATMDFSKPQAAQTQQVEEMKRELNEFEKSATSIFGQAIFFEDDEEES